MTWTCPPDCRACMAKAEFMATRGQELQHLNVCRNGHLRTPENTRVRSNGHRTCRTCDEVRQHAS